MTGESSIVEFKKVIESGGAISSSLLVEAMKSTDIETQGAAMCVISDHYSRVRPPLDGPTIWEFVRTYLERCLRENPQGEFADSRYQAGDTLANWFKALWKDSKVPRTVLKDLKDMLTVLYKEGDEPLREAIVNATLEHVCEVREIARYFSDWQHDPVLSRAYELALEWGKGYWSESGTA